MTYDAQVVHPGDKLLIRLDRRTTRKQADEFAIEARERLPGVEVVVVVADQIAVVRHD